MREGGATGGAPSALASSQALGAFDDTVAPIEAGAVGLAATELAATELAATELARDPAARTAWTTARAVSLARAAFTSLRPLHVTRHGARPEERVGEEHLASSPPDLEVVRALGQGGMGVVELARQTSLDREVAIKTPRADAAPEVVALLLREARIAGRLEHPNVLPIHALGVDELGVPVLVMKRAQGRSWSEALRESSGDRRAHLGVLIQLCRALELAHASGIIHRDVKPDNVMVGEHGEVYLLDWGIALDTREPDPWSGPVGTPIYAAPELVDRSLAPTDERTDVYLVGASLHHVLTGQGRHEGGTLHEVLGRALASEPVAYGPEVPAELARIANRATARERELRYPSIRALREALGRYLDEAAVLTLLDAAEGRLTELEALAARAPAGPSSRRLAPAEAPAEARAAGEPRAGDAIEHQGEGEGSSDALTEADRLFFECRFGFEQALRTAPASRRARRGERRAMQAMVRVCITAHDEARARRLLSELESRGDADEPLSSRVDEVSASALLVGGEGGGARADGGGTASAIAALRHDLEQLTERLARERARVRELAARGAALDVRVASRARARAATLQGVLCVGGGLAFELALALGLRPTHLLITAVGAVWSLIGVVTIRRRDDLRANRVGLGIAVVFFMLFPLLFGGMFAFGGAVGLSLEHTAILCLATGMGMLASVGLLVFRPYLYSPLILVPGALWVYYSPARFGLVLFAGFGLVSMLVGYYWFRIARGESSDLLFREPAPLDTSPPRA